jgi:hypothetical protein
MDRRQLRLKLMVKRRHKPISHSEIATIADHASQKKVGSKQRLPRIRSILQNNEARAV